MPHERPGRHPPPRDALGGRAGAARARQLRTLERHPEPKRQGRDADRGRGANGRHRRRADRRRGRTPRRRRLRPAPRLLSVQRNRKLGGTPMAKRNGMIEYPDGRKAWYRDGQLHRDDGPAIEDPSGRKAWYRDGQLHRDDGPAVEDPSGYKEWYRDGQRHRDDGPAVEDP